MAKAKVTHEDFLKNMELDDVPAMLPTNNAGKAKPRATPSAGAGEAQTAHPARTRHSTNGRKHIGGYVVPERAEQFALLKLRLGLDNTALIERAIDELYRRENAATKFGDR